VRIDFPEKLTLSIRHGCLFVRLMILDLCSVTNRFPIHHSTMFRPTRILLAAGLKYVPYLTHPISSVPSFLHPILLVHPAISIPILARLLMLSQTDKILHRDNRPPPAPRPPPHPPSNIHLNPSPPFQPPPNVRIPPSHGSNHEASPPARRESGGGREGRGGGIGDGGGDLGGGEGGAGVGGEDVGVEIVGLPLEGAGGGGSRSSRKKGILCLVKLMARSGGRGWKWRVRRDSGRTLIREARGSRHLLPNTPIKPNSARTRCMPSSLDCR